MRVVLMHFLISLMIKDVYSSTHPLFKVVNPTTTTTTVKLMEGVALIEEVAIAARGG